MAKGRRWRANVQRTKGSEVVLLQPVLDVLAVDQRLGRKVPPCPEEREDRAAGELERVRLPDLQQERSSDKTHRQLIVLMWAIPEEEWQGQTIAGHGSSDFPSLPFQLP